MFEGRLQHRALFSIILAILLLLLALPTCAQGPEPLINDTLIPMHPLGDGYELSKFMIGRIGVGIVLLESDGSLPEYPSTEDWTREEITEVLGEIEAAFSWWIAREPMATLEFVWEYHVIETPFEPISCLSNGLWTTLAMYEMGYNSIYEYNAALIEKYDTDWAFTIYVVDSSNDEDNKFPDGKFAFAYLGGPYMVMTLGNNGYGVENMDMVCAHEIGHIFWALDQYWKAAVPCERTSGVLSAPNQNSNYPGDCLISVGSIMKWPYYAYPHGLIDHYARGQVGWWDQDEDGILDPVDPFIGPPPTYTGLIFVPIIIKGEQ